MDKEKHSWTDSLYLQLLMYTANSCITQHSLHLILLSSIHFDEWTVQLSFGFLCLQSFSLLLCQRSGKNRGTNMIDNPEKGVLEILASIKVYWRYLHLYPHFNYIPILELCLGQHYLAINPKQLPFNAHSSSSVSSCATSAHSHNLAIRPEYYGHLTQDWFCAGVYTETFPCQRCATANLLLPLKHGSEQMHLRGHIVETMRIHVIFFLRNISQFHEKEER